MKRGLGERSTPDLVVLALTVVVAFVVIASTLVGVTVLATGHPEDVVTLLKSVGELTSSLIAVIIGYVGGRGAAALNGNANKKEQP